MIFTSRKARLSAAEGSFAFSRLIRDKDIKINGKKVGENKSVFVGDEIVYYTTQKEENATFFDVVHEDENVLIADKYSGNHPY